MRETPPQERLPAAIAKALGRNTTAGTASWLPPNPGQNDADGNGIGNRCDGDSDNSGETTSPDLVIMRERFFGCDAVADMDSDGRVSFNDPGIRRSGYPSAPGPGFALPTQR